MWKSFYLCSLAVALMAGSAYAGGSCCCSGTAPATAAQPGAPAAQAQRPQATRSYSYQPSTNYNRSFYGGARGNAGFRSADSKALGKY
jgi:hypothetical protein